MRTRRALLLLIGLVVAALAAGCLPTEDWSQFGFNERHTGFPSQETTIMRSNVGSLAVRWSVPLGADNFSATPLVAGGRLFVFGGAGTRAYDTTTHRLLWSSTASGNTGVVANGQLYLLASTGGGPLTTPATESILDVATGHITRTYQLADAGFEFGPIVFNGVVYFAAYLWDDTASHSKLYRQAGTAAPTVLYTNSVVNLSGDSVFYNGQLDVTGSVYDQSAVLSFNPTTGALNWVALLPNTDYANGAESFATRNVSAGYGNLYVTGVQGIEALSASTGKFLWKQDRILCETIGCWPDDLLLGRVAVADNRVYINAYDGTFVLNPATGAVLWHDNWQVGADEASPTIANGLVYALGTTGAGTTALIVLSESTGAVLKTIPGLRSFDPIVYGGQLFEQDDAHTNIKVLGIS